MCNNIFDSTKTQYQFLKFRKKYSVFCGFHKNIHRKMHFEKICRICLGEGIMSSIFESEDYIGNISIPCTDMLLACATVTVSEKDGFPSQICIKCRKQLCSAYKFRILCENSFKIMLEYVANIIKDNEIKLEKEETPILDSNLLEIDLSGKDIKDEDDSMKVEEFDDIHNDRASPFDESSDSPIKLVSNKGLRGIAHEKRKLKRERKKNLKLKIKKQTIEKPENLACSLCPRTFKWRYLLISHQDSHIGIKRYFCDLCGKSYRSEKDHRNMHKRGNTFKCEVCDKCFNTKAKQVIHIATHSSDRERIVCSVEGCNKTFLSLGGLDRHRFSHTGLKNFICHLCSKSFIDKYQLEIHIRSHTNERPFPCSVCSKSFITSSARISHERWHTNTKNYHCDYCDKSFVCSSGRKRHLLIHSKEQLQSCRFCSKKFSRYDNKKRHEMAMHGVSDDKTSQIA